MNKAFEMANLTRNNSGEPFDIWIDSAGKERNTKHNEPRVKASNNGVTIIAGFKNGKYSNFQTAKDKIKQFGSNKELEKYLIKIKPLLELHWENEIDDQTFLNAASFVKQGYDVFDAVDKAIKMWENI
nr:hypothetical protein DGKKSRWO_DGKKSRWO_CDS_0043 [uncultured phage]CAI9752185.1 hypothetical protein CVNMHQAP_CVNMHQAP_CDS_0043 [uncultured phage]